MDLVFDQLSNGCRLRILNIIDEFPREVVGQLLSPSISDQQVARFLDEVAKSRLIPRHVVCENGTEFASKVMFFWSKETNVKLSFIKPRKPTQNVSCEILNGEFRREHLNQHWFRTLDEARYEINLCREHYSIVRLHSSLSDQSPVDF